MTTTEPNFITLKIKITDKYKLQCFTINEEGIETIIQLPNQPQEEYSPTISFGKIFVTICQENDKSIEFIQQWIEHPSEFTEYQIQFQEKEFELLPEVIFALIISQFKTMIEKEFIIDETFVEIPSNDFKIFERMKVSLESIGLKNFVFNSFTYDYSKQGEQLLELMEMKKEGEKYQRMIENVIEKNPSAKEKMEEVRNKIMNEELVNAEMIQEEINKHLTLEERNKMKICQLDNYCIFIASRYFETVEDHVNLTFVSKRMRGNMEKFHYNPTSVDYKTVKLFPNVETLHLYAEKDEYLEEGRIERYVNWNKIPYNTSEEIKGNNQGKEIEFKHFVWTIEDTANEYRKQNPTNKWNFELQLTIPEEIKEMDEKWFGNFNNCIKCLTIPSTIKTMQQHVVSYCGSLTNITLPLKENHVICGNRIFSIENNHFKEDIYLPNYIQIINGQNVDGTKMEIPSIVTSLDKDCFRYSRLLKNIVIPKNITMMSYNIFKNLYSLENLTISSKFEFCGNRLFMEEDDCLYSVHLPSSVKTVNGENIKPLQKYSISDNITKLSDYCFADCEELSQIEGLEQIEEFGKGCLKDCPNLKINYNKVPQLNEQKWKAIYEINDDARNKLEEWTGKSCDDVIFDSKITKTSFMVKKLTGKGCFVVIIQDETGEMFGYYCNSIFRSKEEVGVNVWVKADKKSFQFNLNSNGRLDKPMKYEIEKIEESGYKFEEYRSKYKYLYFGDITICTTNFGVNVNLSDKFNYHEIKNPFIENSNGYYRPKRIVVIGMELTENEQENIKEVRNEIKESNTERRKQKKQQKEQEEEMKKEQEIQRQENLEKQLEDFDTKTKKQLEKWTGMKFKEMIYDTDIDAKSGIYSSTFINKYLNERNNFLLYIEDTNGEKFGYFVDNEGLIPKYGIAFMK